MRKKSILFLVLITVALLCMSGIAQANFAIHGGYLADTDACAGCHRAHTATSAITWIDSGDPGTPNSGVRRSALLIGPPTTQVFIFCYVCHSSGAPGAATDVEGGCLDSTSPGGAVEGAQQGDFSAINTTLNGGGFELLGNDLSRPTTSTHEIKGAAWQAWGKDENIAGYIFMDCCSCHDPHGSSNYRILKDYVNGHWVGGYGGSFTNDVDPDPLPFVISSELGYPLKGKPVPAPAAMANAPTSGFRLHRQYNDGDLVDDNPGTYEYIPSYTKARYARGFVNTVDDGVDSAPPEDMNRGMSQWCTACHENYMAGSLPNNPTLGVGSFPSEYEDGATSISLWSQARGLGTAGDYPTDMGCTSILVTTIADTTGMITADQLLIKVADIDGFPGGSGPAGFPDPAELDVNDIKYIGIWDTEDVIMTNEGEIAIPKFEMVAYNGIDFPNDTFIVPAGGRGAFDTAQQAFGNGAKVFLGYDASDGYGDLVRHRHPINVSFDKWQDNVALASITWVAGDRALVLRPNEWQSFDGSIPEVDIPIDHEPWIEQSSIDTNIDLAWTNASRFADNDIDDWIECLTCHRAHGTEATMSGFAGATLMPATIEGFNTLVPNPGTDDGVPPTGDSALLRADNRGVCERCHNK